MGLLPFYFILYFFFLRIKKRVLLRRINIVKHFACGSKWRNKVRYLLWDITSLAQVHVFSPICPPAVLLACLANQRSSNRPGRYSTAGALAGDRPESSRNTRSMLPCAPAEWSARHSFATYHSPYILIDIVLRQVNLSAGLHTRHETEKIGQAHLQAGRPTTLSGHMRSCPL